MRITLFLILTLLGQLLTAVSPACADVPPDCNLSPDTVAEIRLYLTAEDNVPFLDMWTAGELVCATIDIYYNDPEDAYLHDRVLTGAVVLMGMTGDSRAVPVLIDAIDTHPSQALYNLGNFPTVDALNALVANVRNEDDEARENAAEGLRRMQAPATGEVEDGWAEALDAALVEVGEWMIQEPVEDFRNYFLDAYANLENLQETAQTSAGTH